MPDSVQAGRREPQEIGDACPPQNVEQYRHPFDDHPDACGSRGQEDEIAEDAHRDDQSHAPPAGSLPQQDQVLRSYADDDRELEEQACECDADEFGGHVGKPRKPPV